jgi:hypothetical protein
MTTELENPANDSCGVSTPDTAKAIKAQSATISERILPNTKNIVVITNMITVISICTVLLVNGNVLPNAFY